MNNKRLGGQTVALQTPPSVLSFSNIGGKFEGEGPLASYFDELNEDSFFGEKTWEKAESAMQKKVLQRALGKANLRPGDLDYILAGDLLNQCIGSSFSLREFGIPFYGLYGACSTMGESLALASMLIDGGFARRAAAMTSSHFCTAERQYRMPVPYGSQRTPTAMAPAAYSTLSAFFRDTGTRPEEYDLIITGDLGELGHGIVREFFQKDGVDLGERFQDCGLLLYDRENQDMHAGASGCGCSASVLNGYLLTGMRKGRWKKVLFAPTGALLSPTSSFQGESVPGICHAVSLSAER